MESPKWYTRVVREAHVHFTSKVSRKVDKAGKFHFSISSASELLLDIFYIYVSASKKHISYKFNCNFMLLLFLWYLYFGAWVRTFSKDNNH